MEDNPFMTLISQIRGDVLKLLPVYYRMGEVKSSSPLTVDVAGTTQEEDSLLKNSLLSGFNPGDQLLLLPIEEEQRYIIMCKVVSV